MVFKDIVGVGKVYHSQLWPLMLAQVSDAIWHKPLAYREGVTVEAMFRRWNKGSLEFRDYQYPDFWKEIDKGQRSVAEISFGYPMSREKLMSVRVSTVSRNYNLLCAVRLEDGLKEINK